MQNTLKREELDYPSIIFRQLDRINELFCGMSINSERQSIIAHNTSNAYNAIKSLDSMIKYKLPEKERKEFEDKKQEQGINSLVIHKEGIDFKITYSYLDLVMEYIFKTNILPKERVNFTTGDD
jgi:hypothetical protein